MGWHLLVSSQEDVPRSLRIAKLQPSEATEWLGIFGRLKAAGHPQHVAAPMTWIKFKERFEYVKGKWVPRKSAQSESVTESYGATFMSGEEYQNPYRLDEVRFSPRGSIPNTIHYLKKQLGPDIEVWGMYESHALIRTDDGAFVLQGCSGSGGELRLLGERKISDKSAKKLIQEMTGHELSRLLCNMDLSSRVDSKLLHELYADRSKGVTSKQNGMPRLLTESNKPCSASTSSPPPTTSVDMVSGFQRGGLVSHKEAHLSNHPHAIRERTIDEAFKTLARVTVVNVGKPPLNSDLDEREVVMTFKDKFALDEETNPILEKARSLLGLEEMDKENPKGKKKKKLADKEDEDDDKDDVDEGNVSSPKMVAARRRLVARNK